MSKIKVKLTNPSAEPYVHEEFAKRGKMRMNKGLDVEDVWLTDEDGQLEYTKAFKKGDVMQVSPPTAQHLIMSGQAELDNAADAAEMLGASS